MAIADDILYDPVLHRFYGTSAFLAGSTFYDMNAFYAHAVDIEDNPASAPADEFFALDANQLTYKTNGDLYIEQELIKHLRGAALETTGHNEKIRLLSFQAGGYVSAIATDIGKPVVGTTTTDSGVLLDYDNTARKWWIRVDDPTVPGGDEFDVSEAITITGGTGAGTTTAASATGEDLWTNMRSIGVVNNGFPYIYRGTLTAPTTKLTSWWGQGNYDGNGDTAPNDYHVDILIKARESGALIDSGNVIIFNRNWGDTFDHATANLSGGGVVTVALASNADGSITLTEAQAQDLTDGTTATVVVDFSGAPYSADVDDNDVNETYSYQGNHDSQASSDVYQAYQWMLYKDSITTINSIPGDAYTLASGAFTPLKAAPLGQLSAGILIYAQGGYPINPGDGNYQSRDNAGTTYSPPASIGIGFSSGTVAGDYCTAFQLTGPAGTINKAQYTVLVADLAGATVQMSANLQKDTPTANNRVRLVDPASGEERVHRYSSRTGDTLTLPTSTGTATSADPTGLVLTDSVATFQTDGIEQGDLVRNTTDGSTGIVASVDSETQLTLRARLSGGVEDDWDISDAYTINALDRDWDALSATAYIGFVDGFSAGTSFFNNVQFVATRDIRYKVRNSSPASPNKIKRFVQEAQATSSGGTIPASRNPETLI